MIKCLLIGGILACQIIKTVVIVKVVKAVKNYFIGNTEEEGEN